MTNFAPSPTPANSSSGFAGTTSVHGFQALLSTSVAKSVVRLVTGAVTRTVPIVSIPTLGTGFGFVINNNSQDSFQGSLGPNWRHNYEMKLVVDMSLVTYINGDGQHLYYIPDGSGGWKLDTDTSLFATHELTNPSGTIWELKNFPDETVWRFDATALSGYPETAGRLLDVTDHKGNVVSLQYTAGKLTTIEEPEGREITLSYTGDLLSSVTDPISNTTLLTYDDFGNLRTVSGPEGCTVTFDYATPNEPLITAITDARGNTTRYEYLATRITRVIYPDGNKITYRYRWDHDAPWENTGNHGVGFPHKATQVINSGGEVTEYRFDKHGNLWRVILPSGNIKRYFWSFKQRFLYCSEGPPMLFTNGHHGPSDNINNRYTRCTVNGRGDTIATLEPTGILDTFEYDEDGRLLSTHPGKANLGVQGNWPEYYGKDGYLLCAFESDDSDVYQAPDYLDSSLSTAITNGDGGGNNQYVASNQNSLNLICPRTPIKGPGSLQRGIGFWKQTGTDGLGTSFEFSINLTQTKAFNLSIYSHSVDLAAQSLIPLKYNGEFGRDIEIEVEDVNGVQSFRIHNNAPGFWTTFPVEGDTSNPIRVTVTATGANNRPVISALAFDEHHDRRSFYEYTDGQLTKVINALGEETVYTYNSDGTMADVTDARNNTTSYQYLDSYKNLTKVIDADTNETTLVYDDNGNVTSMTDANSHVTTMTYDGKNRMLTVTDPLSRVTTFDYDGNGNLLSIVDAMNRTTTFTYTKANQLSLIENELGHSIRIAYDINGRRESVTDARGFVTRFHYNEDGNLIRTELPDQESISYSVDVLNQVVAVTGPNGNQDKLELMNLVGAGNLFRNPSLEKADPIWPNGADSWVDANGNRLRDTSQSSSGQASLPMTAGTAWKQESLALPEGAKFVAQAKFRRSEQALILGAKARDSQGAPVETTVSMPIGDEYSSWKSSSSLLFEVPGDSHTTASHLSLDEFTAEVTFSENVAGWLDELQLNMLSEAYHHDIAGRLKFVTAPTGARTYFHRDKLGRVVATVDPAGERVEMVYDALDRVTEILKPSGETISLTYNEVGALASFTDGLLETTSFVYDDLNRLTSIVYPDSSTEDFTYDDVGNLASYTDIAGQSKSFAYDDADRLVTITYASDSSTITFTYDDMDNLLTQTERNDDLVTYTYDDIDRLTSVTRTAAMGNSTPEWEYHYTYDENGNRLTSTDGSSNQLWRVGTSDSRYDSALYNTAKYNGSYDAMNRPLGYWVGEDFHMGFRYDPEGRRTAIDYNSGISSEVAFDIVGRPLNFTTRNGESSLLSVDYNYDIRSNRTSQVTGNDTFDYQVDQDGKLVGEAINRLVSNQSEDFLAGELEQVTFASPGLELLSLDDTMSSSKINCDRWRLGQYAESLALQKIDPENFLGPEIRQDEGLHFVFPRGYTNRLYSRDIVHPLNDDFGLNNGFHKFFVEHRCQLAGDFDIRVDFSNFQTGGWSTSRGSLGLYISLGPMDLKPTKHVVVRRDGFHGYLAIFDGSSGTALTSSDTLGALRLIRSGSTVTAYYWNSSTSTWTTTGNWSRTFSDEPVWVGLSAETSYFPHVSGTFKNFVFDASSEPVYASSGTFTSPVYDAGRNVSWQNLSWSETLPAGSDVELQVAFADSKEGPWTFVGPDGTPGTRFTASSGQSVGVSVISRYCRYKAFLSGDNDVTPSLNSVELSYSGNLDSQYRSFVFDAAGNMTQKVTKSDTSLIEESRTYDELNQITENVIDDNSTISTWAYTHDPNGNMTSKTDGVDTYVYSWSEDNQLLGVELNSSPVVSYEYDSGSRMLQRIEGSISTNYHWDGWDLVREEKDDGVATEITNYLVPQGEVLAFQRDGDWFYLHGDGLSSTQLVTDESGAQVGRAVYGAWGETLSFNESVPGSLDVRFVGGLGVRNDAATGLIWMRHRWYDSELGRFVSRDPVGFDDDFHFLNFPQKNPRVLLDRAEEDSNFYAYSSNSPTTYIDSDGLNSRCFEVPSDKYTKLRKLRKYVTKHGKGAKTRIAAVYICNSIKTACYGWCATHCGTGSCQTGCEALAGACAQGLDWPKCAHPGTYDTPRPGLMSPR